MDFDKTLPFELKDYQSQIEQEKLPLQWVQHAHRLMLGVSVADSSNPEYHRRLQQIEQLLAELGDKPTVNCDPDHEHAEAERQRYAADLRNSPGMQLGPPLLPCQQ